MGVPQLLCPQQPADCLTWHWPCLAKRQQQQQQQQQQQLTVDSPHPHPIARRRRRAGLVGAGELPRLTCTCGYLKKFYLGFIQDPDGKRYLTTLGYDCQNGQQVRDGGFYQYPDYSPVRSRLRRRPPARLPALPRCPLTCVPA